MRRSEERTHTVNEPQTPVLVAQDVSKVFASQVALNGLNLEMYPGQVHALLGENGSGKSTFIKILSGYHQPETGSRVTIAGVPLDFGSAAASAAAGMRFVHQDRGLVDDLDVADNLALGNGFRSRWWVTFRGQAAEARRVLGQFGVELDLRTKASALTALEKTLLAIARALHDIGDNPPRVLVLDEPTESLSKPEVERLFGAVRAAAGAGTSVLYVSHNIDEVLEIADTVSVLKDGNLVATVPAAEVERDQVIEMIVGRELEELTEIEEQPRADVALRVSGLYGELLDGVSFDVAEGEIVGVAGLSGAGQDELPYLLGGARPWDGGSVTLNGRRFEQLNPTSALDAGIVFVSSDRARESAIPEMTAYENITLPHLNHGGTMRWLSYRRDRADARDWMQRTDVRPCDPARMLTTFSGGNQQKVVLARALRCRPKALVLDHPVQGVDIGAKFAIYELLLRAAEDGIPIVVAGDPEDLVAVCHRVLVFRNGRIDSELPRASLSVERITEHCLSSQRNTPA